MKKPLIIGSLFTAYLILITGSVLLTGVYTIADTSTDDANNSSTHSDLYYNDDGVLVKPDGSYIPPRFEETEEDKKISEFLGVLTGGECARNNLHVNTYYTWKCDNFLSSLDLKNCKDADTDIITFDAVAENCEDDLKKVVKESNDMIDLYIDIIHEIEGNDDKKCVFNSGNVSYLRFSIKCGHYSGYMQYMTKASMKTLIPSSKEKNIISSAGSPLDLMLKKTSPNSWEFTYFPSAGLRKLSDIVSEKKNLECIPYRTSVPNLWKCSDNNLYNVPTYCLANAGKNIGTGDCTLKRFSISRFKEIQPDYMPYPSNNFDKPGQTWEALLEREAAPKPPAKEPLDISKYPDFGIECMHNNISVAVCEEMVDHCLANNKMGSTDECLDFIEDTLTKEKPTTTTDKIELNKDDTSLNSRCVKLGIKDPKKCNELLSKQTTLSNECTEAGINRASDCNNYLLINKLSDYCEEKGLSDDIGECQEKISDTIIGDVSCVGLSNEDCAKKVAKDHLGDFIDKSDKLKNRQSAITGNVLKPIPNIEEAPPEVKEAVNETLSGNRPIYMHPARGGVVLTEGNELKEILPAIILVDDDGDGLPNDMEKRLGLDPSKTDSDGDGVSDKDELLSLSSDKVSPLDSAIIKDLTLEQPAVSGEIDEAFDVAVTPSEDKITFNLNGEGTPSSVLALYIYSSLPMVISVETDESGNWTYNLKEGLSDGEHEVYIVLHDDTGAIEKKSTPVSLFVKEAQAVSMGEFFGIEGAPAPLLDTPVDTLTDLYMWGAAVLVVISLFIYAIIATRKKKEENIPKTLDE